jgi:hypothetical protein
VQFHNVQAELSRQTLAVSVREAPQLTLFHLQTEEHSALKLQQHLRGHTEKVEMAVRELLPTQKPGSYCDETFKLVTRLEKFINVPWNLS